MTMREFYEAVIKSEMSDELVAFAQAGIDKMDAANEKRKNTKSKAAIANEPLMAELEKHLGAEPMTASDAMGFIEASVQKTSNLLRALVKEGRAKVIDVKVPKKGIQKGYLAPDAE